jgi:hypothetical protein
MGGRSLRLDPNPRETYNTHRTHRSSYTKHKSDTCQTQSGDQKRISNNLELALLTRRTTLILLATQEHRKAPKPITYKTKIIHPTWLPYINQEVLPFGKQSTYETITSHISTDRETAKKRGATHIGDTYMTPGETLLTPYDVIEIQDHRQLNN